MKNILPLIALLFSFISFSQETACDDEIDNDGDGLIDCFDEDCGCDTSFYIQEDIPDCQFQPDVVPTFDLQLLYTTNVSMDARQNMVVGDLDGDGINEIVAHDDETNGELYVFDGTDGSLKYTISDAPRLDLFFNGPAIADTDEDGLGEIFIVASNANNVPASDRRRLIGYEFDGIGGFTRMWVGDAQIGNNGNYDRASPQISDFNEDGVPEIYVGNQIFNSADGTTYAAGPNNNTAPRGAHNSASGNSGNRYEPFPIAADILPDAACANCAGVELVAGNSIYSIDDANGTMAIETSISGTNLNDGLTSVVDFDRDGDLDVAVVSLGRIYVWDGQTSTQIGSTFNIPAGNAGATTTSVGGRLNIADFDGDGELEIGTAGNDIYIVLDNDLTELWSIETQDGSQRTGSTVFDFEGDGINEVVYRDERDLFILNGTDGSIISQIGCRSGTRLDYPIIVDVNNDGQTEIVTACGGGNGNISVFNSSNQPWVPSRPVWNQHGYYNTQVEDDLTILQEWQDHSIVATDGATTGPLNTFLTQATYRQYDGTPTYAAPDASIDIETIAGVNCLNDDTYKVAITITNKTTASNLLPQATPFSVYAGDPYQAGATYLDTGVTTVNLAPGESETISLEFNTPLDNFQLYALINDNGTGTLPLAEDTTTTNIGECDYSDNEAVPTLVDCSVLPVKLLFFEATKQGSEDILLTWATASEQENDYFTIEHSTNGIHFSAIQQIQGAGNSTQQLNYSYLHVNPNAINNYYKLVQVDEDGSSTDSDIVYISLAPSRDLLTFFDQSANELIITTTQTEIATVTIFDSFGRLVQRYDYTERMGLSNISNGIYFVVLDTDKGKKTHKIVVY